MATSQKDRKHIHVRATISPTAPRSCTAPQTNAAEDPKNEDPQQQGITEGQGFPESLDSA